MKKKRNKKLLTNHNFFRLGVLVFSIFISIITWYIFFRQGVTVAYNDAMAHLNLARMVVDNLHPGFSQLGGVWLPLNHLLELPAIWDIWAWHSGFAGSIISMISYIVSVYLVYETLFCLYRQEAPSLLASGAFSLNVNMLYLQSTPLTEPLFLVFFVCSCYFFVRWLTKKKASDLILLSLAGFFIVLTRYDGWFVVICELGIIFLCELFSSRKNRYRIVGSLIVFALPFIYGIVLWLLWNKLIFGNFLYFALGDYSAHAQQSSLAASGGLITKHNILLSLLAYCYAVLDNVGFIPIMLGIVGGIGFFIQRNRLSIIQKSLLFLFLVSPVMFNIVALFIGFSILNVPELHWNPSPDPSGIWFNVRYGIVALPFIAFFVGYCTLLVKKRIFFLLIFFLLLLQTVLFLYPHLSIITLTDGLKGSSSFQNADVAAYLKTHVKSNARVLLSMSYFSPVVFQSGLSIYQIIHEGVPALWAKSFVYPYPGADWIVTSNGSTGDSVYNKLLHIQKGRFLVFYKVAYRGAHTYVFRKRTPEELYIRHDGTIFLQGTNQFFVRGVNSYDLSYQSLPDIEKNFSYFHQLHINTIRLWAFGDGFDKGFQPSSGVINEERFKSLDYILYLAAINGIRVVPVLVNNGNEYGGKHQYTNWIGVYNEDDFYTNPYAISLFKNYINKVASRVNTYTHIQYRDDPTILSWEIMNEPHLNTSDVNTKIIFSWLTGISSYIKTIDTNHLVSIGTQSVNSEGESNAFVLCAVNGIDYCSIHLNLDAYTREYESLDSFSKFLMAQQKLALKFDKPVIAGEAGVVKNETIFNEPSEYLFSQLTAFLKSSQYNGVLIWNWSILPDDSYGFSPQGTNGVYTLKNLETFLNPFQKQN